MDALGRHILAEFFLCDRTLLNDTIQIEKIMCDAAVRCGATIVQSTFHTFNPHGVSGVVVIQESHLAIHTWPEYGYAAIDVFTCGQDVDPWIATEYLKEMLGAKEATTIELKRGEIKGQGVLRHKPVMIAEETY